MMLTIDANVFVSAASLADALHPDSDAFLRRVQHLRLQVHCPALLLPETASAIVRPTGDVNAARITLASVETFPSMNLVSLTKPRAQAAAQMALLCRLRGADAIYAAVAQEFGTTLITWDAEMLARCPDPDADRLAGGIPDCLGTRYNGLQSHLQLQT